MLSRIWGHAHSIEQAARLLVSSHSLTTAARGVQDASSAPSQQSIPGHSAGVCPCGRHHLGPACSLRPAQQGAVSLWHRAMSTVALGHHEASSQWPATQGMQDAQQQEPHAEDVRSWFPKARTVVWSNAAQAAFPWLAAKNLDQEPEPFEAEFDEEEHEVGEFEDLLDDTYDEFEYDEYELEPLDLMSDEEEGEELAEGVRKEVQEGEAAQQKAPAAKQKQ